LTWLRRTRAFAVAAARTSMLPTVPMSATATIRPSASEIETLGVLTASTKELGFDLSIHDCQCHRLLTVRLETAKAPDELEENN
jgi:hypothetical protein